MERQQERDLSGQVAIVTGASRGIGRRTAISLAARGVKVVVAARTVDARSDLPGTIGETVRQVEALGGEALAVATDLAEEVDLHRLVEAAVDRFGGVDLLVNNAAVTEGHSWSTPIEEMPRADWLYHFAVNLHAPFTLIQRVVPIMERRGGGRILNVTTGSGEAFRVPEEPPAVEAVGDFSLVSPGYFSSKRALDRLSNVLAGYLAQKGIFIISMHPGFVASEIAEHRAETAGLDGTLMIPMDVPARLLTYFAACQNPLEYAGRIFAAERDVDALGLETGLGAPPA